MMHLHVSRSAEDVKQHDAIKSNWCKEYGNVTIKCTFPDFSGITLITIPYWWDKKFESLAATIHARRPDLFDGTPIGTPIPWEAPSISKKHRSVIESKFIG
jgi:hypothetical protein